VRRQDPLETALIGGIRVSLRPVEQGYEALTPSHEAGTVAVEATDASGRRISGPSFIYQESPFSGEQLVSPVTLRAPRVRAVR